MQQCNRVGPAAREHLNFDITIGDDPFKNLWGSVLRQALQDVGYGGPHGRGATVWIAARRTAPCSFEWVCDALGLNAEVIRKHMGIEPEAEIVN